MEHVILCLQLLRTFSHFPVNLSTMISCQATAAVLGSMAVYKEEVLIQEFSLDILAKIALYKPTANQKVHEVPSGGRLYYKLIHALP